MIPWDLIPFDIYKNILRYILIDKYNYKIAFLIDKNCYQICQELITQFIIIQRQLKTSLLVLYLKSKINYRIISTKNHNVTDILWNDNFKNIILDIYRAKRLLITISKKIY